MISQMDSNSEGSKKTNAGKPFHVAECVRQFELHQQYPSTITELRSKPTTTSIVQTKSMQNILSSLPLSGKMKFIPNKEISLSENLQKLKFRSISGKDLAELKLVLPGKDEKMQTKIITMSKNSEKPATWALKSQSPGESQKPRIKTIKTIFKNSSTSEEHHLQKLDEASLAKLKLQVSNTNNASQNVQNNNKSVMSNSEGQRKIIVHQSDGNVIKKYIIDNQGSMIEKPNQGQYVTLKKLSGTQKVIVTKKENPTSKSTPEIVSQLKPVSIGSLNNLTNKTFEKIIMESPFNGTVQRKRDSSSLENVKTYERKKPCLEVATEDLTISDDSNDGLLNSEQNKNTKFNSHNQLYNVEKRKNVMVIVPNEAAGGNSTYINNEEIVTVGENDMINSLRGQISPKSNQPDRRISDNRSNNLVSNGSIRDFTDDGLSIVEKALLSVQDANLREKALKALKDCGIKVKKRVPIRRPRPTKIIGESATQTEVFSMLKEGEFILANETVDELVKIKETRKTMKPTINTLLNNRQMHVSSDEDMKEFKSELDKVADKFSQSRLLLDVREAFGKNKTTYIKPILKQLKADFDAAKNYDDDGLLGIHRAVFNNNMRHVQRQIMILKAMKKDIDITSQDDKTSLELAIQYDSDPQIIKILLDSGAKPVSSKPIHDSALILAAKTSSNVLPLLFEYITPAQRPLLNAISSEGLAAIHYCAQQGNLEGVSKLLKHGANVNLKDERSGKTALFYVVEMKNNDNAMEVYTDIAHKLLEHGAYSNIPTFSNHSVLSLIDDVKSHALKIALNRAVK